VETSAPAREVEIHPAELAERLITNVTAVMRVPPALLSRVVVCLLAEGHLILEDVPGVGKTKLAKALAASLDIGFRRLQFTPDLLPTDVTGVNVFDQANRAFTFRPGPVFTSILLVDEINRAGPKTQSALLECMEERQVTIDGQTRHLPRPFMVIATQNPIEYEGTYPLPEAQLDRFAMRLSLGYPSAEEEVRMLADHGTRDPLDDVQPIGGAETVLAAIDACRQVHVEPSVNRYVVALLGRTRHDERLLLGASPRSGISLIRLAKAAALLDGRDYVMPDDVKQLAPTALAHRLILSPEARARGMEAADVVEDVLARTPVPVM
jgi:MoxR-like ATPase